VYSPEIALPVVSVPGNGRVVSLAGMIGGQNPIVVLWNQWKSAINMRSLKVACQALPGEDLDSAINIKVGETLFNPEA
jgi:hypothetical protein